MPVAPPAVHIAPAQAVSADRLVVDQGIRAVVDDLEAIVGHAAETDVRLERAAEDQCFRRCRWDSR